MLLDERTVPLPPDNDGNEDVLTSQSTNRYPPARYQGGDSPLASRGLHLSLRDIVSRTCQEG
jgi:hypothetical protein